MSWMFDKASASFDQVRDRWDALNGLRGDHILLDSRFVAPLIRHFGTRKVLLGINDDSRRPGMALVVKQGSGSWASFQPSQSPLGLILLGYHDGTGEGLQEMLGDLPGYALQLSVLQQDPDYSSIPSFATQGHIEVLDYIQTARLPLTGSFEEYWNNRGKNLRHNLDRQRRRITEKGQKLELVAERDIARISECLREYGRLESHGWKGQEGTAVSEDNAQGRFYREIFEGFCARGEGVIFQLRLDGKVVASDLCLMRNGMLVVLKTAYDEGVNGFSPALLMRQDIVRHLYADGATRVIEFYGRLRDWHTKWTDQIRTMYHVNLFRSQWVVKTRNTIKRFL